MRSGWWSWAWRRVGGRQRGWRRASRLFRCSSSSSSPAYLGSCVLLSSHSSSLKCAVVDDESLGGGGCQVGFACVVLLFLPRCCALFRAQLRQGQGWMALRCPPWLLAPVIPGPGLRALPGQDEQKRHDERQQLGASNMNRKQESGPMPDTLVWPDYFA